MRSESFARRHGDGLGASWFRLGNRSRTPTQFNQTGAWEGHDDLPVGQRLDETLDAVRDLGDLRDQGQKHSHHRVHQLPDGLVCEGAGQPAATQRSRVIHVVVWCYHCAYSRSGQQIMEVAIRKMGNSQGVLIPKPILAQVGLEGTADLQVRDGVIEIRAIRRNPREGWADDARRLAEQGGDALVWPEVANKGDDELVW
jgi:antitoxin MazE